MRLLVVSSWFPCPPDNGAKIRAFNLIEQLARRHEVTLFTFAEEGEATAEHVGTLQRLCGEVRTFAGNPHKAGRSLRVSGLFSRMPRSYRQTYSHDLATALAAAAPAHDAVLALEIGAALHLRGVGAVPRVFEEAEVRVIEEDATRGSLARRWRRALTWRKYAAFTRALVREFDATTVVSGFERDALGRAGCDLAKVHVVDNGVSSAHLAYTTHVESHTLVYPGSPTYAPNFEAARWFGEEVLPRLQAACEGVRFTVTGRADPAQAESLTRLGVVLSGHVEDIRPHIAGSTVCVVPLRTGGGTRLKILEALALGTPVVSTTKGAEGLELTPGQDLLIADDAEAFASAVTSILVDPALRARLSERGRLAIAARYTWDRIGRELEGVLEQVVSRRPGLPESHFAGSPFRLPRGSA